MNRKITTLPGFEPVTKRRHYSNSTRHADLDFEGAFEATGEEPSERSDDGAEEAHDESVNQKRREPQSRRRPQLSAGDIVHSLFKSNLEHRGFFKIC